MRALLLTATHLLAMISWKGAPVYASGTAPQSNAAAATTAPQQNTPKNNAENIQSVFEDDASSLQPMDTEDLNNNHKKPTASESTSQLVPFPTRITSRQLFINTPGKCVKFQVRLAETGATRAKGLSRITSLPLGGGMLFIFPSEYRWSLWMKNTFIALDMIFMDKDGVVVDIVENALPHSLQVRRPKFKSKLALEINAGLAQRLGITPGRRIFHKFISKNIPQECLTAQTLDQMGVSVAPTVRATTPSSKKAHTKK